MLNCKYQRSATSFRRPSDISYYGKLTEIKADATSGEVARRKAVCKDSISLPC